MDQWWVSYGWYESWSESGGSGEQALLTAACVQMARHFDLPSSTIAGATDSKIADAQAGYEKALNVTLAAQAGCNFITQACGMQASLMAASLEALQWAGSSCAVGRRPSAQAWWQRCSSKLRGTRPLARLGGAI